MDFRVYKDNGFVGICNERGSRIDGNEEKGKGEGMKFL